ADLRRRDRARACPFRARAVGGARNGGRQSLHDRLPRNAARASGSGVRASGGDPPYGRERAPQGGATLFRSESPLGDSRARSNERIGGSMTQATAIDVAAAPRVLLEESHDLPLVSVSIGTTSGGIADPDGREGLTRLTGRLMRRTGGGRDPHEIDMRIDSLGASLSVDVGHSVTVFHATVIRRSLEPFMELVTDVLERPGLADAELARLKRETQAELVDALDDDRGLARRWFRRKLFAGHPYGRPLSGTSATLEAIQPSDVHDRARSLAARDALIFAWSGDIDGDEATRLTERVRAALPSGPIPVDRTPEPTVAPGRRLVIVDKPERTQTQILIGGLGTHPTDPDHTALLVGNTIFGGTFTARLTEEVRSKRGWSYGAYSSLPFDRRRQAFSMWTF